MNCGAKPKTQAAYNQYGATKTTPTVTKQTSSTGTTYSTGNFQQGAYAGSNYAAPAPPKPQISSYTGKPPGKTVTSIGLKDDAQQEQKKPSATGYYTGTSLNAGKTTGMSSNEREIRNMIKESNMTPFQASNFESALGMKDEKLNSALLAEMKRDGTEAVSQRMQTQRKAASTTTATSTPANTQGVYDPEKTGAGLGGWGTPNLKKDPVPVAPGGNKEKGKSTTSTVRDSAQGLYDPAKIGAGLGGWGTPNLKKDPVPVASGGSTQAGTGTAPTFRDATQIPAKDTTVARDAYRAITRMTELSTEQRMELLDVVDANSLSFVRALNKDMRKSSPESIYSTYVTRARAAVNPAANPNDNSTLNLHDSEREIRNMLAESGLTPFDAQRFENALDMKDEKLNNALLAAMKQDGTEAVNERVQTAALQNNRMVQGGSNPMLNKNVLNGQNAPIAARQALNASTKEQTSQENLRQLQREKEQQMNIIRDLPAWEKTTVLGAAPSEKYTEAMQRIREIDKEMGREMKYADNLKDELNPNVTIPPEIKNEISKKMKEIRYEESFRSGKDFGPKNSKYITEEIGVIGSAAVGPSATLTIGLVGGDNGQDRGKVGLSVGGAGFGAYGGLYGIETTAPYEVWANPNTKVMSVGFVGGYGIVAGYNHLIVAGSDGKMYDGRMVVFGIGAKEIKGIDTVDFLGGDLGMIGFDFPIHSD